MTAWRPLRRLPLRITVDGVAVIGTITYLSPSDLIVARHRRTEEMHVPHFAMVGPMNWYATFEGRQTVAITSLGRRQACAMLRTLYRGDLRA